MKIDINPWQSNLSTKPPWPGIDYPKSLILKALLTPEAKNPPKGAISEANPAIIKACIWAGLK